jgi:hypothetical protein
MYYTSVNILSTAKNVSLLCDVKDSVKRNLMGHRDAGILNFEDGNFIRYAVQCIEHD